MEYAAELITGYPFIIFFFAAALAVVFAIRYRKGSYYQITKLPYLFVRYNAGRYGEYLTYQHLKHMEREGAKFLFNLYIPKKSGETTEIDVLMICRRGIFVFECKNYGGWIYGSENQKNWCQTFPAGRGKSHKEFFYNPIMQNQSHIRHLKSFLGEKIPFYSIIVFSHRCLFKKLEVSNTNAIVTKHGNVAYAVGRIYDSNSFTNLHDFEILSIYNRLYRLAKADEATKKKHVETIQGHLNGDSSFYGVSEDYQESMTAETIEEAPYIPVSDEDLEKDAEELTFMQTAEAPAPTAEAPAPTAEAPAPTAEAPAPTAEAPAPTAEVSAPAAEESSLASEDIPSVSKESSQTITKEQAELRCPRCNGRLVLRTATRGSLAGNRFYGCINYPKCRYVRNIANRGNR